MFNVMPSILNSEISLKTVDDESIKLQLRTLNKPDVDELPNLYKFIGPNYEKKFSTRSFISRLNKSSPQSVNY